MNRERNGGRSKGENDEKRGRHIERVKETEERINTRLKGHEMKLIGGKRLLCCFASQRRENSSLRVAATRLMFLGRES